MLLTMTFDPPVPAVYCNGFCVSCAAAVVTKARDTIEPVVMTQTVTKAKEGKFTASKLMNYK